MAKSPHFERASRSHSSMSLNLISVDRSSIALSVLLCGAIARAPRAATTPPRRRMRPAIPPSDGDCHTPLPREVRKGTIPRHEGAVFTLKEGWTAALAAQPKDERLSPVSPLVLRTGHDGVKSATE